MASNKAFGGEEREARGPRRILSFDTLKVSLGELREGPPHQLAACTYGSGSGSAAQPRLLSRQAI